ncbi:MAG TPA: chemotaxis protein CheW [Sphingobium sp.]|nr:chemotaxis protein CheW [Sphingobium sp.]
MTKLQETQGEDRKIVTFTLGQQMFGIDMRSLIEIREWEEPTPLPSVPSYVKGVTNLRGSVVPVVGLAERLGWTPSVLHSRSCILVVAIGQRQAGFLVDEVADIVAIDSSDIQPAPDVEVNEQSAIAGLVRIERRTSDADQAETMVLLLDLDALSLTRQILEIAV